MSCLACSQIQDADEFSAFYRWKNASVEIRGCAEHLKEVFEALDNAQKDIFQETDVDIIH